MDGLYICEFMYLWTDTVSCELNCMPAQIRDGHAVVHYKIEKPYANLDTYFSD